MADIKQTYFLGFVFSLLIGLLWLNLKRRAFLILFDSQTQLNTGVLHSCYPSHRDISVCGSVFLIFYSPSMTSQSFFLLSFYITVIIHGV